MFHHRLRPSSLVTLAVLAGALAAPARGLADCVGDCNYTSTVEVVELVQGVNQLLGRRSIDACPAFDDNDDKRVTVNELVSGVRNALLGCNAPPPVHGLCGDGQIADDEVCDDGNIEDGDGCSADCAMLEGPGVIDQAWLGPEGNCGGLNGWAVNIGAAAPIGQEFVPQRAALTEVAVSIWPALSTTPSTDLQLVIHADSITGPAVAEQTAILGPLSAHVWQRYDFSPPVELTPGRTYVIELVDLAQLLMWSVAQSQNPEQCFPVGYEDGSGIFVGSPNAGADLGFVTFAAE